MTQSRHKTLFAAAVAAMAVTAAIVGMLVSGSPGKVRDQRFDIQRQGDLQELAWSISRHFEANGRLPETLSDLKAETDTKRLRPLTDPETGSTYEYQVSGDTAFRLCATFSQEPPQEPWSERPSVPLAPLGAWSEKTDFGRHGPGRQCFDLDAHWYLPKTQCSLQSPCPAGQQCVVLPGSVSAVCVPQGKECLAAGCPGGCELAESYPIRVVCESTETPKND